VKHRKTKWPTSPIRLDAKTFQSQLDRLADTLCYKVQREPRPKLPQPPFMYVLQIRLCARIVDEPAASACSHAYGNSCRVGDGACIPRRHPGSDAVATPSRLLSKTYSDLNSTEFLAMWPGNLMSGLFRLSVWTKPLSRRLEHRSGRCVDGALTRSERALLDRNQRKR
jgi:hypothetical protein